MRGEFQGVLEEEDRVTHPVRDCQPQQPARPSLLALLKGVRRWFSSTTTCGELCRSVWPSHASVDALRSAGQAMTQARVRSIGLANQSD